MADDKKVPQSRLGRLTMLARVGAKTGASLLLGRDGGSAAAAQAAELLGNLRGLAAKMGQMASYVDGMVPETHREAYETALRRLRAATPTSSPAQIRQIVEDDLHQPLTALFAEWDEEPIASASIGQVHRARLRDEAGTEVAVKVQHPGIRPAVEADLANASVMQGMVDAMGPSQLNSRGPFEEIKRRFREELDYTLEARHQQAFSRLHQDDPAIDIPQIFPSHCSQRVLTSAFKRGRTLEDVAEQAEAQRQAYAQVLWRFVFRGNLIGGMFNADPHPGNYLFLPEGRVVFLDFGCVQPIAPPNVATARAMHLAAIARDEAAFATAVRKLMQTKAGAFETAIIDYTRRCFEPLFASPFHVTRPYVRSLVEGMLGLKSLLLNKKSGVTPLPDGILFMNRLQFGFYSVLARLDVAVDYAQVERAFLHASAPQAE